MRFTRVDIVTMRPTPAASARATMPSRSSAKSGKSRWQWLSISIGSRLLCGARFDIAREHRRRLRKNRARLNARLERGKVSRADFVGNAEKLQKFCRGGRHGELGKKSDLSYDFCRDVKNGALARGIGLCQCPGSFSRKVTVGLGDNSPNGVQCLMNLLRGHGASRQRNHAVRLCQD